jgi:hypothetical protein
MTEADVAISPWLADTINIGISFSAVALDGMF